MAGVERIYVDIVGLLRSAGIVVQNDDRFFCNTSGHARELHRCEGEAAGVCAVVEPDLALRGEIEPHHTFVSQQGSGARIAEVLEVNLPNCGLAVGKSNRKKEQRRDCKSTHERRVVRTLSLFNHQNALVADRSRIPRRRSECDMRQSC